ncbi:MAG: hypothetical protein LQ340_002468 [Diploschistes diacapsis]|nr:MAG: hypothetical protein LQ340_002468 [Diploschistes diacapsis]
MAPYFPPPSKDTLLLPLLACLPFAFVSRRPPPALLPMLSPILRQRVKLLSDTVSSDSTWLPLLCWESDEALELPNIIETVSFEPHPVSGEVEFGEIDRIQYRKLDEETLQSVLRLSDVGLEVHSIWCEGDQEGGEDGWRVSELKPLRDPSNDTSRPWYNTVSEADEKFRADTQQNRLRPEAGESHEHSVARATENTANNDDDYWAQYDQAQSQTPAQRLTPGLQPPYSGKSNAQAEDEYYARYDGVQPEMDNDDPSANRQTIGYSSLNGNSLPNALPVSVNQLVQRTLAEVQQPKPAEKPLEDLIHTRPSSSSSASSSASSVAKLERSAHSQSQAEVAIQQHISTTMKSLYRLTRGAGIEMSEFRRLVQNELDTVTMMDEE